MGHRDTIGKLKHSYDHLVVNEKKITTHKISDPIYSEISDLKTSKDTMKLLYEIKHFKF